MSKVIPFPNYDLPIFLSTSSPLTARLRAVVIGSGPVGLRKTRMLLDSGARVRVVSLSEQPADLTHNELEWRIERYCPDHLDGADLVVTAAPSDVSHEAFLAARAHGILVCRADCARWGDFLLPATLRRGERFQVAISTRGASPALVRRVRERLAEMFDESFGEWVDLLAYWRDRMALCTGTPEQKQTFLNAISDWPWLERFRSEGYLAVSQAYDELARQMIHPFGIIV